MASEIRDIGLIKLREKNPRQHSLEQIEQISAAMRRWGWTMPLLVDETDTIIAGHGRYRAARLMGYSQAPVIVARGWSEEEKSAYVIADNQIAQNSDWDPKLLRAELRTLVASEFDMDLIGFDDEELTKLVIDPVAPKTEGPKEVTMIQCDACGRMSRKKDG